jgi:hypothetical protein
MLNADFSILTAIVGLRFMENTRTIFVLTMQFATTTQESVLH